MKTFFAHAAALFASLGGLGIFLLAIVDSSFLFLPLGLDLLVVALTARHHDRMWYYAAMAAAGSVVGCFTTDWLSRKGGEAALEHRVPKRRLAYIQKQVRKRAGIALALAAVAPPGFPFTPVVIVAAALKYPQGRLLGIVAVARFIRFSIEGMLAVRFGKSILEVAEAPAVQYTILAVVVLSFLGSALSLRSWLKKPVAKG